MASSFKYPDITRSEIIGYLAHFGFASNVTEQDLLNPTRELVENIYTHLLNYLDLIQEDDEQADFAALEVFHNPDLHVSTVPVMNLLHKMRGLLAAIDCPGQFTLWDLIKPDPDRTKLFLGSLLNFCTHRTIKMDELTSLAGELDVFVEQKQALEEKLSQLNAEITQCNELRAREALLVQEEEAKVKELKQTIAGLNNHQVSLKSETRKMKERAQELDELTSNVEFELVQSAQENAHLRYKIVQSPDKLQKLIAALEEKKSHQVEAKNTERAAMQAFQDKNATLELYTKALKKMSKSLEQMKAIQEQANSVKSVEKEIKALKCKLGEDEMLDKSLDAKLVEKQGKADQLDEMKKKVEIECILAREEATKELNNVKSQVESTRNGLLLRKKQVETVIAEIISVGENAESQCQQLKLKHEEVAKEFMMYSNKVGDVLKRYRVDPPTQQ